MHYHYVYRITNIIERKHYYGKRSSKIPPTCDLGVVYFSSSKDTAFRKDQKINPGNYRYKIIKIFDNHYDSLLYEIKLHNRFNVGINPHFYNRSKQSSEKFDTSGMISVKDKNGIYMMVNANDPRYMSGEFVGASHGRSPHQNERMKISLAMKNRNMTKEHRENLSKSLKGIPKSDSHKENLSKSMLDKGSTKGHKHPRFKRYYCTPLGKFDSPAALIPVLSLTQMKNWCMNCDRLISEKVYTNSTYLNTNFKYNDLSNKTYRDIGFFSEEVKGD